MQIYLIPGIGADGRLFHNIDLKNHKCKTLSWIPPKENDTLAGYAAKLLDQVDQHQPFALIGVSLGGMMAVEMAKISKPEKTILISSAKTRDELPLYLRIIAALKLHRIYPAAWLGASLQLIKPFFGKMNEKEFRLFKNMFEHVGPEFVNWAKNAVMEWDNSTVPERIYHIHGTNDKVLPPGNIKGYIPVAEGGHYMIVTKAKRINPILLNILAA